MMSEAGFNYALPLWYEDHLTGLLLLDASPRIFLDEEEPILRGLTRQISHSIENLRVVEEKIALEKTVLEQEHLAKLGRAAAAIAHEVKNPLSSIKTLVQLMREDAAVESTYSRDLKYIVGEIDRLNGSVMQLLSFSRPAADLSTDVDVSGLLDATLSTLGRQSRESGVEIERQIDRSVILKRSNPELLQQVVLNLVLNAVQASPEGGKVRIAAHASGNGSAVVSIEDEGTGIPAQNRERIFEPFFTTKQKGTGLGLAIVQKNVRQLRGKIEVESPLADGRGTRVTLTLPLER
jgi:signal transduction histidine kinase